MLNAGADKVAINTAAVFNPDFVREAAERFGSQCIVVAIDAKQAARRASRRAGKFSPTAAASPPASTRSNGRRRWWSWAPVRSC